MLLKMGLFCPFMSQFGATVYISGGITVCNFVTDKQTENKAKPLAFAI